jgi:hypothetical protein
MQQTIKQPFSNVQLELLRVFSHQVPENDLLELKQTLALFFAKKLTKIADNVWDKEDWNDDKVEKLLNTKLRKSH